MRNPFKKIQPEPSAVERFYTSMAQVVPTHNKETNQMQMTVDRQKLVAALTEKREEVRVENSSQVEKFTKKLEEFEAGASSVGEFLRDLAKIADEHPAHFRVHGYDGGIYEIRRNDRDDRIKYPHLESTSRHTKEDYEEALKVAQKSLEKLLAPYDAALNLLDMSTDVTVGIDGGDYHNLLGGLTNKNR